MSEKEEDILKPDQEPEEDITATINHAHDFHLPGRQEGESTKAFRARISSVLRDQNRMIEAHEAWTGKYFDQGDTAIGIMGSVAMQMNGLDFGTTDGNLVGDEIAVGHASRAPKRDDESLLLLLAMALGGRDSHK